VINASEQIIGVAELARRLRRAVEGASGHEWVEGEVGSLKRAPSGHLYFSLKDEREDAVVDCVMYRLNAQRARRVMIDGARVQVLGRATVWAPRGRLQFVVEFARSTGRGALLEALENLKQRLAAEGLFAALRKRALPAEPRVIGVVTSAAGAAFQDICKVAFRRGSARIVLSPALVQGEAAPISIVRAIDLIERYPGLDALIVGRGGGSAEDLMPFNDERVVRRIVATRVPVVSAVGHEVDISLTDLAADVRAATPSQAAELLIPDAAQSRETLRRCLRQLTRAAHARMVFERSRVDRSRSHLSDPRFLIAQRQQHLDELAGDLERCMQRALARRRAALAEDARRLSSRHPRAVVSSARAELGPIEARLVMALRMRMGRARSVAARHSVRLEALSPLAVLSRGYAIVSAPDGRVLRSASDVGKDVVVRIRLHQGALDANVTRVHATSDGSAADEDRG
jgi:exodeoxyribonuclease VII large subunit